MPALILDSGAGADADPIDGNWSPNPIHAAELRRVGGQIAGPSAGNTGGDLWNAGTFGPGDPPFVTLDAFPTNETEHVRLWCRLSDLSASLSGYMGRVLWHSSGGFAWQLYRYDAGSGTLIGEVTAQPEFTLPRDFRLLPNGSTLTLQHRASGTGDAWTDALAVADATYPDGGYIGLTISGAGWRVTDFGVGEATAGGATFADAPTGAAAAIGAIAESAVYTASPAGAATATGAALDALTGADAPTGTAAPTGVLAEAWARGFLDAPTGAATATGLLADALASSDALTGTAAPSGSVVEAWAHGLVDTPTGLALATGSLADALARSESPTGAAAPGGALADALAAFDAAIGIAAPSGSAVEAWGVGNLDAPAGTALATGTLADALAFADAAPSTAGSTGAAIEAWAQAVAPTGAAQPHGSIVELWAGPPTGRVTFGGDVAFPDATGGLTPTGAAGSGSTRASVEPT